MNINPNHTNSPQDYSYRAEIEKKSVLDRKIIFAAVLALIVLAIIIWFLFFRRSSQDVLETPQVTPTEVLERVSPTVEPTEAVEVKISDLKIQVLNGSGIAGEAGKVAKLLEGVGFQDIETRNADSFDFTKSQVRLKSRAPEDTFDTIKKALGDNYEVVLADPLPEDEDYDVVVIVGKKEGAVEEPTPSLTPTPTET